MKSIKILITISLALILFSGCTIEEFTAPWDMTSWTKIEESIVQHGEYSYESTKWVKDGREIGRLVKINGDFELWYEQEEGWAEKNLN